MKCQPVIAISLLVVSLLPYKSFAASPINMALPDDTITRVECEFGTTTYHYDLYIPVGYSSDTTTNYPVLFVFSPGGNAVMGNMESWLRDNRWLAVMLVESRNGPWDPIIENFSAAHDDLILRTRVQDDRKFLTGMSGGARASAYMAFNEIRPGLRGIFLQAAGFPVGDDGYYTYSYRPNLFIYAAIGDDDSTHLFELDYMEHIVPDSIYNDEIFSGGHAWAPADVAARALDWLDTKVQTEEYGVSGRLFAADACLATAMITTDSGQEGSISPDDRWYVINGLIAGTHTIIASATNCDASPQQYRFTVPPDASEKNFSINEPPNGKNMPYLSLLLSRETIFSENLSEDPNVCYLDCGFIAGTPGWRADFFFFLTEWQWAQPSCGTITGGHTGNNVLSYNPAGTYYPNIPARTLRSPVIDCTGFQDVQLEFWRWLEVQAFPYDTAKVEVTNGDGNWHTVWANPTTTLRDTAWSRQAIDISTWADNQSTVTIRWTMGPTNGSTQYCGWNIDDIKITGR
jgi:hypothetical protein